MGVDCLGAEVWGGGLIGAGFAKVGYLGGRVVVDGPEFLGAEKEEALEAELTVMAVAFGIGTNQQFGNVEYEIHSDCMAAIETAGGYSAKADSQVLHGLVSAKAREARAVSCVVISHVKSHVGQPWNEGVDVIAKQFAAQTSTPQIAHLILPEGVDAVQFRKFSFIRHLSPEEQIQLPKIDSEGLHLTQPCFELPSEVIGQWYDGRAARSSKKKWRPSFDIKAMQINILTLNDEKRPKKASADKNKKNAPSARGGKKEYKGESQSLVGLDVPGRALLAQESCHRQGFNVVGLAETRDEHFAIRSSPHYIVISSGCSRNGAGSRTAGCQILLARVWKAKSGEAWELQEKNITVVHFEPRRLYIKVSAPFVPMNVTVNHGPGDPTTADECTEWWGNSTCIAQSKLPRNACHISCMDCNECLAENEQAGIGPLHSGTPSVRSEAVSFYPKGGWKTWRNSSNCTWHRYDYIAVCRGLFFEGGIFCLGGVGGGCCQGGQT